MPTPTDSAPATPEEKASAEYFRTMEPQHAEYHRDWMREQVTKAIEALTVWCAGQRVIAQSCADDAKQMRQAAERAPAAQKARDIAHDAMLAFTDRVGTAAPRGEKAEEIMRECVRLAAFARKQAEAP